MRDPAGICGRVPELISLAAAHPPVKGAIATGDPHAVYRALRAIRRRLGDEERATVDLLLSRRALFLRPLGAVPSMHTVNGIGTTLHGRSEADAEAGTYVATHCLVLLFVPVLPLGQYLVSDAGPSTFRFYGRVPETTLVWAWRRAAWVVAVILLASATWAGLEAWAYAKVDVVNPLDARLRVTINEQVKAIEPGMRQRFEVPRGEMIATIALDDGTPVQAIHFETQARADVLVLNPLGASATGCGEEVVRIVDGPPPGAGGWQACVAELWQRGEAARSAEIARRVAGLFPGNLDAIELAAELTRRSDTPAAAAEWLRPIADAQPLELRVQRELTYLLQEAGRGDEAATRYRALHAANPGNPDALYLRARVEDDPAVSEELVQSGLLLAPHHPGLLRALGWLRLDQNRWTDAAEALARAEAASPMAAPEYLVARVSALAGAGRADEALALVEAQLDLAAPSATLLELVAALAPRVKDPASAAERLAVGLDALRAAQGETAAAMVLLAAGRPLAPGADSLVNKPDRPLLLVAAALLDHPDEARRLAAGQPPAQLARLGATSWILLRGEAMRAGDTALQTLLDEALDPGAPAVPSLQPLAARAAREYIGGGVQGPHFDLLYPAEKAAAYLARSRQPSLRQGEAERLRREAESGDPLQGLVSHAAYTWPP